MNSAHDQMINRLTETVTINRSAARKGKQTRVSESERKQVTQLCNEFLDIATSFLTKVDGFA